MDDATFWQLIEKLDWSHEGDDEKVVAPVVAALAAMSPDEIGGFQEVLADKLHALDGRAWARESGDDIWWDDADGVSVDSFLYARCVVVANGPAFFEQVLANPKQMPKNMEFESLLYVAPEAFRRRTGREPEDELETAVSFETFSNAAGWPPR